MSLDLELKSKDIYCINIGFIKELALVAQKCPSALIVYYFLLSNSSKASVIKAPAEIIYRLTSIKSRKTVYNSLKCLAKNKIINILPGTKNMYFLSLKEFKHYSHLSKHKNNIVIFPAAIYIHVKGNVLPSAKNFHIIESGISLKTIRKGLGND